MFYLCHLSSSSLETSAYPLFREHLLSDPFPNYWPPLGESIILSSSTLHTANGSASHRSNSMLIWVYFSQEMVKAEKVVKGRLAFLFVLLSPYLTQCTEL